LATLFSVSLSRQRNPTKEKLTIEEAQTWRVATHWILCALVFGISVQESIHVPPGNRMWSGRRPTDFPMRKAHDTQNMSKKMRAKLLFVWVRLHERSSSCSNFHTSCALCITNLKPLYRPDATFVCYSIVGGRSMRKQKLKEAKRRSIPLIFLNANAGNLELCVAKTFKNISPK